MEALSDGLNIADCRPIVKTIARMKAQFPVHIPIAPQTIAPSSRTLAAITTWCFGNRSANHPAGAANRR